MDDLEETKITRGGLMTLCRCKLTYLNIGKFIGNIDSNRYGDEGARVMARYLPSLQELWVQDNELGWEGVAAIARTLTALETLSLKDNKEVSQGATALGRLPTLKELVAGTCDSYTDNTKTPDWTAVALTKQRRRLTYLWIGKYSWNSDFHARS